MEIFDSADLFNDEAEESFGKKSGFNFFDDDEDEPNGPEDSIDDIDEDISFDEDGSDEDAYKNVFDEEALLKDFNTLSEDEDEDYDDY